MTSNVFWFAELGLADLEQVGGKNSSLGEMVVQPGRQPGCGCRTASPPPPTPTAASSATPGWPSRSTPSWPAWTPTTCSGWPSVGKEIRAAVVEQPFPADLEADIRAAYEQARRRRR